MDMVEYAESVFESIKADYLKLANNFEIPQLDFIPISALRGDNIVNPSTNMDWYTDKPLLNILENVETKSKGKKLPARFPVQWVIRPQTDDLHDYRGYAGRMTSGSFKVGERVVVLPSGFESMISHIELDNKQLKEAKDGASVVIRLEDDIDISRGDLLAPVSEKPIVSKQVSASLCWMDTRPLDTSLIYLLQINSRILKVKVQEISYKVNINTMEQVPSESFELNDIGKVILRFSEELAYDAYATNKLNGGAILIDSRTNLTVGAVLLE
jgi:sulfate adenylyltransferase subunit 1